MSFAVNQSDILDIRHRPETGVDLKREIVEAVGRTQNPLLITPLPNILVMTTAQFDDLQHDPEMQQMYNSKDFLYITPLNAMECRVQE